MSPKDKLRLTRQRQVVLEEVRKADNHPSADEVYQRVRQRLPRISLGTVYRSLELLSELGEIRRIESAGSQRRFDGRTDDHYHVRCTKCARVEDVALDALKGLEESARENTEFEILGHRLEFFGVCPECKATQNTRHPLGKWA